MAERGEKGGFRAWLGTNQGVGAVLVLVLGGFLVYLRLTPWVHRELRDGFTLGFFPVAGVLLMMLFAAVLIADGRRRQKVAELASLDWKTFSLCLLAVVASWVYFELLDWAGFLLVSPLYLLLFMGALGMRPWRDALVASVLITGVVYLIFRLLGIELPSGILPL